MFTEITLQARIPASSPSRLIIVPRLVIATFYRPVTFDGEYYWDANNIVISRCSKSFRVAGPGRPPKLKNSPCTWCGETKLPLKYVLPTQNGKKEFCSETCLSESRKTYARGACVHCESVIRGTPFRLEQKDAPTKDFCSSFCLNAYQKKEMQTDTKTSK